MDGFILINKPSGPTSHDVVEEIRAVTGISQIGHAGTLDPLAEGLLILLIGSFTKKSNDFIKLSKEYRTVFRLGLESDTHDVDGEVVLKKELTIPLREDLESVLARFHGNIKQIPPQFSAIKRDGKKAYEEARKGKEIELEARLVVISKLEVIWYRFPLLNLYIACGSGTYIRSLARDIGGELDTGAIVVQLKRTKVGPYSIKDAVDFGDISKANYAKFIITDPLP
jgi:tRNA pseudouridine55 synthase